MLATPGALPDGPEWVYEVRWDGLRLLAEVAEGRLRLVGAGDRDLTSAFPELHGLPALAHDVVLDGAVVLLADGVPDATALRRRLYAPPPPAAVRARPVTYMVFDVLRLYGVPLLDRPWHERRATLERLDLTGHPAVALSPVYPDGPALLAATAQRGMEGVVAKARESGYRPGRTSPDWVAASHRRRRMCLVGGWRPAVDGAVVDALLLGVPDGRGGLRYAGAVDTGHVEDAVQRVLAKRLAVDGARRRPFSGVLPRAEVTGTLWCAPRTVVEVDHLGVAADGRLRRPLFRAVRDDVAPDAVADE